ncbi:hypothetical protein QKC54_gp0975 [Megavirus baoshan]|uniref:Uncharacterized protein n=1 Tax=Megavirus baoshan TaxID=2496520 RepID=A0A8K1W9C0_9VIRU|nr:hypothetical protein QKC54_gp0975 [Megavirus baoshan]UFX99731.1 hypothetical protein Mb0097 [Megavirus baoshan]
MQQGTHAKKKYTIKDENIVKYSYCKAVTIFNLPLADKEPGNNAFCYFNLCKGYTEKQLKKDIMKIHNKRLKTNNVYLILLLIIILNMVQNTIDIITFLIEARPSIINHKMIIFHHNSCMT